MTHRTGTRVPYLCGLPPTQTPPSPSLLGPSLLLLSFLFLAPREWQPPRQLSLRRERLMGGSRQLGQQKQKLSFQLGSPASELFVCLCCIASLRDPAQVVFSARFLSSDCRQLSTNNNKPGNQVCRGGFQSLGSFLDLFLYTCVQTRSM